jgi:hypothetical protein
VRYADGHGHGVWLSLIHKAGAAMAALRFQSQNPPKTIAYKRNNVL